MKSDCCCQPSTNSKACGCCEGVEALTPLATENRPGLPTLSYRIGTHATFLESMKARLSSSDYPKLAELTTREADDPSMSVLDAWATVADVLTFYQERIVNESYLRTATERRSVLELAKLVGYQPRPGVSSSVYLAYTIDDNFKEETIISKGARSQSVPGPGELPQSFETSEDLKARANWNNLKRRTLKPQNITLDRALQITKIYLKGTATNLKANDPLLLVFGENAGERIIRLVQAIKADFDNDLTELSLQEVPFLIRIAVDYLRKKVTASDSQLKMARVFTVLNTFLPSKKSQQDLLENFSFGKYPLLRQTYFSHDRIYRFLYIMELLCPSLEANSFSAFAENIDTKNESLKSQAIELELTLQVVLIVIDSIFSQVVQQQGHDIRDNPDFADLVCLSRHILQQSLPTDASGKRILGNVADCYIPPLNNAYKKWLKDNPDKADRVLNAIRFFVGDPGLKDDLYNFLEQLSGITNADNKKTVENIKEWLKGIPLTDINVQCGGIPPITTRLDKLIEPLSRPPTIQVANRLHLLQQAKTLLSEKAGAVPQMLINFQPRLQPVLYQAWANATVTIKPAILARQAQAGNTEEKPPSLISLHALSLSTALFGNNAPVKMGLKKNPDPDTNADITLISVPDGDWSPLEKESRAEENNARLYLDNAYDNILEGAYVLVSDHQAGKTTVAAADSVTIHPRTAYGISGKTTRIELSREWWQVTANSMNQLRNTLVHVETEKLILAMEPDTSDVSGQSVDLQALYGELSTGRWLIVSGELANIEGTSGVKAAELAMLAAVEHVFDESLPGGDKTHTRITFDKKLVNSFKRDTVTIRGNVIKATHGETRKEVLGSGDGAKTLQSFVLKQPPLTYVSASNPSGVDNTLKIYVNDVQWRETDTLAGLAPTERNFVTKTDDDGKTAVVFGNGREGARLPTGIENIKAEYRNGIGKPGNVKAEQITLLTSRPLGVKEVINPNAASGGADKETRDQARKNAPLAVMALDRLVSVQDYEDFSRIYAGIGKARAVELSDGRRQLVHITIAGADDIPIDKNSDLYRNLHQSLLDFGDPYQTIRLEVRESMLIVISAGIRIMPEYQWESVVTQVSSALLDAFSFDRRELGQDVLLSEVLSVMQNVRGVEYVDVDTFGGIPENILDGIIGKRRLLTPSEISDEVRRFVDAIEPEPRLQVNLVGYKDKGGHIEKDNKGNIVIHPAQIAFITADVPESLILNQII